MPANDDPSNFLAELAELLQSPLLPVQSTIAKEIGEDQPFVSNAGRGILKRVTKRVTKLYEYASSRIEAEERARKAARSVDDEVGRTVGKAAIVNRKAAGGEMADAGESTSDEAMSDLKAYLDDGYDPRLIVEQLVVLRRAQQLRRPGRRRGAGETSAT